MQARRRLATAPIAFEVNRGQAGRRTRFIARGPGRSLLLNSTEAILGLAPASAQIVPGQPTRRTAGGGGALRMRFLGANPDPMVVGEQPLETVANYFVGEDRSRWRRGVATFGRVRYRGLWPGIDALFYGDGERLEYDFVVAPGADAGAIGLGIRGARSTRIDARGDLVLDVGGRSVRHLRPVAYQTIADRRVRVPCAYDVSQTGQVQMRVGDYDAARPLVIDPVIAYSATIPAGSGLEAAFGVAVDSQGAAYVAGLTSSTDIATPSAAQPAHGGGNLDAFVAKLNPAGTALEYVTYLGGAGQDQARDLAVDGDGSPYVTGHTDSADFPTLNPYQGTLAAGDAFVTKLDPSGGALVYSTYLGGPVTDVAFGIALDASRNAYVTGDAGGGLPGTAGAPGPTSGAFAVKLGASGATLQYAKYLGGAGSGESIAVDAEGQAYVAGTTVARPGLATHDAFQEAPGGLDDAFVTKLNAAGTAASYTTYLGGSGNDSATSLAVDAAGAAYVVGETRSSDFPTAAPIQSVGSGPASTDAFVSKLSPAGDALAYSTYLGGAADDTATGVALDAAGTALVTGITRSGDFPEINGFGGMLQGGVQGGFLAQVEPSGGSLVYSTLLDMLAQDVAVDASGYAYVAGQSSVAKYPLDVAPPETTIISGPSDPSASNAAHFTFRTSEPAQAAFACRLDDQPFAPCTSPKSYTALADGPHTFSVRAIDAAQNVGTATTRRWTVAADPPDTSIDGPPPALTGAAAAFTFSSPRDGSTFECRLDLGAFSPCASPKTYAGLSGGAHTFRVRAIDAAGETDDSPAEFTWNVDVTAPNTFITAKPLEVSSEATARFEFSSTDSAGASFQCRLDEGGFTPCTSPQDHAGLADGPHTFRVRSTDAVGNVDPSDAVHTWTVETSRPETTIELRPAEATASASATFTFSASEPATFECQVDGDPVAPCASPLTLADLAEGPHTFLVRAVDAAIKADPTPAEVTWTVDLTQPVSFVLSHPGAGAANLPARPTFAWAATTDLLTGVARYELWIDGARVRTIGPADCAGGCAATVPAGLADGAHTWHVRASDAVGNERTTAPRTFTVDATPPAPFELAAPVQGAAAANARPALSWHPAADAGSGVVAYAVALDGSLAAETPSSTTTFTPSAPLAEGEHTWQVTARDANGNVRSSAHGSFVVDLTAPVPAFTAAPNPALTDRVVTFDGAGSKDPGSGVARFAWDLDGDGTFERDTATAASTSRSYPDPGTYAVALRVTDRAGLSAVFRMQQRISPRPGDPKQLGITINDGAEFTKDPKVVIHATWPSFAAAMLISNDGAFRGALPGALKTTTPWTLSTSGSDLVPKIVRVRFVRGLTVSETYDDDIILDQRAPEVTSARVAPRKGAGAPLLRIRARDRGRSRVGSVQVTNNRRRPNARFVPYLATIALRKERFYPRVDLRRAIYVRARDRAGNLSPWRTAVRARAR